MREKSKPFGAATIAQCAWFRSWLADYRTLFAIVPHKKQLAIVAHAAR
jgi:hypothetical protein